ncbi:MAG TPA: phosphoribosylanthranilate isomerase [Ginsengibacter sp.]|nr:phosphoribosylanthranilate isomerase [Ginsengibacter sp.]HRP18862.1 phosphoribosylanthranilate isomerase [Ginsengibacter sp.]HRP45279.1 phosphoribosylanthranilate isomerase [Ginsengibacter sp.]
MKIKVCGLTDSVQIQQLNTLGVDYTGLIFYKASPRFVEGKLRAEELEEGAGIRTGVFVNEKEEEIRKRIVQYGLKGVQLCGDEAPELCTALQPDVEVIKVVHVATSDDLKQMRKYEGYCDYFLLDTVSSGYGGSGQKFDWQMLSDNTIAKPFFLSGGIDEMDFERIASIHHPMLYGVDINSRFEVSPGIKDIDKIARFIKKIKSL